jgi:hypothetical protein
MIVTWERVGPGEYQSKWPADFEARLRIVKEERCWHIEQRASVPGPWRDLSGDFRTLGEAQRWMSNNYTVLR